MNVESLLKVWKGNHAQSEKVESKQEMIGKAVMFWQFVRTNLTGMSLNYRRNFLSHFIYDNNAFIGIVAIIESLPVSIWRRFLWKCNVNFISFESFFRRINNEQVKSLRDIYFDLFQKNVVPRVFGKITLFLKRITGNRITVIELLKEHEDSRTRYTSKGSWSYNLLKFDFGFNEYPGGETSDARISEFKPSRFLAEKNHADDFIVNTESGIYWWLYKTARSNYAWFPEKKVRMNTHICPGFCMTLIAHLYFWVVSPVMFFNISSLPSFDGDAGKLMKILFALFSTFTPLWCLFAGLKFTAIKLVESEKLKCFADWLDYFFKKNGKSIAEVCGFTILMTAITFSGYLAYFIKIAFSPLIGVVATVSFIISFYIYILTKFFGKLYRKYAPDMDDIPVIEKTFISSLLIGVVSTLFKFRAEIWHGIIATLNMILGVIISIYGFIIDFFLGVGAISLIFLLPAMFIVPFVLISCFCDNNMQDKAFAWLERSIGWITAAYFIASTRILFFQASKLQTNMSFANLMTLDNYLIFMGSLLFGLIIWRQERKYKPSVARFVRIEERLNEGQKNRDKVYYHQMMVNKHFKNLSSDQIIAEVKSIREFVDYVIRDYAYHYQLLAIMIPNITPESMKKINERKELLQGVYNDYDTCEIIKFMIQGHDYWDAKDLFREQEKKYSELMRTRKDSWKKIFAFILIPLSYFGKFLAYIWECVSTLYRLYELFNKRCPYVEKPEVLD